MIPRYISIDIETTGLEPERDHILEFAAVAWTSNDYPVESLLSFVRLVDPGRISGSAYALDMNARLIKRLAAGEGSPLANTLNGFTNWLVDMGVTDKNPVHIIGKNFAAFDWLFLKQSRQWPARLIHRRFLDANAFAATSEGVPSMGDVHLNGVVIPGEPHEALYDARYALEIVRQALGDKQ